MSSTLRLVHSGKEASFSSLWGATWTARSVGTQVNRETASKEIIVSSLVSLSDLMKSMNLPGVLHMGAGPSDHRL